MQKDEMQYMLQKKALEICCYVCGAGAFSVFIRWLQFMQAFTEEGLVDKSVFNLLVPAMVLISGFVFIRIIDGLRRERYYIQEDFYQALANPGKIYMALRWLAGLIMLVGSVMLLISAETDKEALVLQILSVIGIINAFAFPLLLSCANRPHVARTGTICFCATVPIVFFAAWLIACYKINSINPVVWDYGMEIITVIVAMLSFFRIAGFAYGVVKPWRCMFNVMLGAAICIMAIADERYMGMQLMLFSSAMMQVMYCWLMICNMGQSEKAPRQKPQDGFERLRDDMSFDR